jgi:hypothetical protein
MTRLNEENVNCGSCSFKKNYECQRLNSTPFMTLTSLIFGLPHATTSWENIGKIFGESMACALFDFFFPVFVSVGLSESATTVHTGHRTKRANYNDKLLSTELYVFFWIGNRITNWRAWGNQNGSAKIVSEILCNKSSNLWSGWTEIFAPIFTRIPKYSKSRATVWSSYACCNAKLLLEKSAQVRVGQAPNADCIFSFTLLMVPCNHSNPQLPNH